MFGLTLQLYIPKGIPARKETELETETGRVSEQGQPVTSKNIRIFNQTFSVVVTTLMYVFYSIPDVFFSWFYNIFTVTCLGISIIH